MRKLLLGALLPVSLLIALPAVAAEFSFQKRPPEQSLVTPGEQAQDPVQQPAAPAVKVKSAPAAQAQQSQPQSNDDAFYLKPTYISQANFNAFRRQLVQVLKAQQKKAEDLSQQSLNLKIQLQGITPQITGLKHMIMQISGLLSEQSKLHVSGHLVIWHNWWFWVLIAWNVILTALLITRFIGPRKGLTNLDVRPETGGDYDYLSKKDSLPSHLDLAQAYITMNDYQQARRSLEFVVMNDKGELRKKALQLLKQLPKG